MWTLRLLLLASFLTASFSRVALSTDEGGHLDPNGGAVTNAGSSMDPNGGRTLNGGPIIEPDGARLCYTGCVDPNG